VEIVAIRESVATDVAAAKENEAVRKLEREQAFITRNIIRTAFAGGSVYVICSTVHDSILRPLVIDGRTFTVDRRDVIDEVDNENSLGDSVHELCFKETSLIVDPVVTSIALNSY
jgi:hypothetical protein